LENRKADENPVLQLRVNNSVVKVMFSRSDGMDVKNRVRDILTESYEERFQKQFGEWQRYLIVLRQTK